MKVISISGGRSSAMMLKILLDNGLSPDTVVCFSNTGREDDATLDFVHECEIRWNVPIVWLEYRKTPPFFEQVSFETASRRTGPNAGRPFREMIEKHHYLPNPAQRICTAELKIKTIKRFVRSQGHRGQFETFVGLRFDEPDRVARKKEQNRVGKESEYYLMPLNDLRVTIAARDAFWKEQCFDLQISSHSDNCDLCFMKGFWQQVWKIREDPAAVEWWIEMERLASMSAHTRRNAQFRKEYSFSELKEVARRQTFLDLPSERTVSLTCACTD